MMVQCWTGNIAGLHLCVLWRTLTLSEWCCKEAPVNQQGRLQHNYEYPGNWCNELLKNDLNLYPYKTTVLPKLTVQNKHQRMTFVKWAQNNKVSSNNVCFSDEARFHLDGGQ
jgi:hypothetical protein